MNWLAANDKLRERIAELETSVRRLEGERDKAEHLSKLACKARDAYDEERRESYQAMCGWKGRAEAAEAQLQRVEGERDQLRAENHKLRLILQRVLKHLTYSQERRCYYVSEIAWKVQPYMSKGLGDWLKAELAALSPDPIRRDPTP